MGLLWKSKSDHSDEQVFIQSLKKQDFKQAYFPHPTLSESEEELTRSIKEQTIHHNQTNITRTQAYLSFYQQHPELEWALLAHLVSRNSGWSMTDLKGEWLSKLLTEHEQRNYFRMLERANWLIFQDAYPQLLLYHYSKTKQKDLMHLLPLFHVSHFMGPVWKQFLERPNRKLLSVALIMNEQHYIEKRVVHNGFFQKTVIDTLDFKLQELLGLTQILFPFHSTKGTQLAGHTVHQFASVLKRIEFGKQLYTTLFSDLNRLHNITKWATSHPHTGSRKDYWPHLFNTVRDHAPGEKVPLKLRHCKIRKGATRIYSPPLPMAWEIIDHQPPSHEDWFTNWEDAKALSSLSSNTKENIEESHCEALTKIELATAAKQLIFHRIE